MGEGQTAALNDFQDTEIGLIPADWEVVPLQDAATFTRKPRGLDLSEYEAIPFIPMELVPDNGTLIDQYDPRQGSSIRSGTYCEKGDILLAKITPSFENGKQGIVGNIPMNFAYATTEVYPIQTKPHCLHQMFLFHFFRLPSVRADIAGKMEGSTGRQRIPKAVIERYPIPLPPLAEQRRIAHVLSTIQRAIAAQEDVIAAARETKRSLMERLFRYGPGAEPAPTKETEIGEIPKHWEVQPLEDLIEITSGQVDPREMPYLKMIHIGPEDVEQDTGRILSPRTAEELRLKSGKYLFTPEHVVYSKIRPYLRKVALPSFVGICSADMYPLRPRGKLRDRRFLYYTLLSDVFTQQAISHQQRTGIPKVNRTQLQSVRVPVPLDPEEQWKISDMLDAIEEKIEAEIQRKVALEALFQSTLQQLMTGQIRLREDLV